jgi:4-amino-4-deoxy-L-arabinose transferase-like glycosyltransferase
MSEPELVEGRASRSLLRLLRIRREGEGSVNGRGDPTRGRATGGTVADAPVTAPARPRRRGGQPDQAPARLATGVTQAVRERDIPSLVLLAVILAGGAFLRVWNLNALGYNSDEAVYAGQAAALAGDDELSPYFPIFRAHPLLFQSMLSIPYHLGGGELAGRLLAAAFGVATIYLVFKLGDLLYGRQAGLLAALVIALMPYTVVVSRQVLLDGPMVFFATLTLYALARYVRSGRLIWLYGAGGAMGLTFLAKETSILLLGAIYTFLALSPELRLKLRHIALSFGVMLLVIAPYPLSLMFSGKASTGQSYLTWQLFRRPNHSWDFYPTVVPPAIGFLVIIVALAGLIILRREAGWRERLLVAWIAVPLLFFMLWPVKGFQYLLPIAPPLAVLAGRALVRLPSMAPRIGHRLAPIAAGLVAVSLVVPTWQRVEPSTGATFLAGSGGVVGGREAGRWIDENIPEGAVLLTLGPSMANILQFYGHRKAFGLSVSPNPLHRNPSYEPVGNPDLRIRHNEIQYLVWDSFSADRSPFFAAKLIRYVDRYNGRVVHSELIQVETPAGKPAEKPVITIFAVRA